MNNIYTYSISKTNDMKTFKTTIIVILAMLCTIMATYYGQSFSLMIENMGTSPIQQEYFTIAENQTRLDISFNVEQQRDDYQYFILEIKGRGATANTTYYSTSSGMWPIQSRTATQYTYSYAYSDHKYLDVGEYTLTFKHSATASNPYFGFSGTIHPDGSNMYKTITGNSYKGMNTITLIIDHSKIPKFQNSMIESSLNQEPA